MRVSRGRDSWSPEKSEIVPPAGRAVGTPDRRLRGDGSTPDDALNKKDLYRLQVLSTLT